MLYENARPLDQRTLNMQISEIMGTAGFRTGPVRVSSFRVAVVRIQDSIGEYMGPSSLRLLQIDPS
jgi:hypothetical protein